MLLQEPAPEVDQSAAARSVEHTTVLYLQAPSGPADEVGQNEKQFLLPRTVKVVSKLV